MKLTVIRSYFGPNPYASVPIAYLVVVLKAEEYLALTSARSDLERRISEYLRHTSDRKKLAGFIKRTGVALSESAKNGVGMIIETAVLQVLWLVAEPVDLIEVLSNHNATIFEVIIRCSETRVGCRATELAVELLDALAGSPNRLCWRLDQFLANLEAFQRFAASLRPTSTQAAILIVANERKIPVIRFDRWPILPERAEIPSEQKGMMQLGLGIHGKRLMETVTTAITPETFALLADRVMTHAVLLAAGIRVPARDLEFKNINSLMRAVRSAQRIGYPVVLKPKFSSSASASGVSIDIRSNEDIRLAFKKAANFSREVIIERYITGDTYQLLVIGGMVIAASRRTVKNHSAVHGESIPINLESLNSEIKITAIRAAACFDLDVAGIDVVTEDFNVSLEASRGAVVQVDLAPDLNLYRMDGEALPLHVARLFVAHLIPQNNPTRIPIVAISGTKGKTTTCRMAARILAAAGHTVGLACSDGVYVGSNRITCSTSSGISGALHLFTNRQVEMAVLEVSRGTLVKRGLGYDWADVGVCTNVTADHIGLEGIETVAEMADLKGVVITQASKFAIVNADCPLCLAMLKTSRARQHCWVTRRSRSDALESHLATGGLAIVLEEDKDDSVITLRKGTLRERLISIGEIPATWGGAAQHNVQNAMFAAAIGIGMGAEPSSIKSGLAGFESSLADSPGRINCYDRLPFTVIVDACATAPSSWALCDFVDRLPNHPVRIIAFHGLGDRRDDDLQAMAKRMSKSFDHFFCYDFAPLRGRHPGEVPNLLANAL